ncbi:MAG: hypothetical protein IAE93_12940 [Ignavibacteria bacterium]|nr:hypothetical protein [Ignavibacteria bacterium]
MFNTELKISVEGKSFTSNNEWINESIQEIEEFTTINPSQLKRIAEAVKEGIEKNISTAQKYSGGSVAPLKPSTVKKKGSSRPLFQTGQLLNSVTLTQISDNIYEVFISSNRSEIASYLHFGTQRMQARPFFGISESVSKRIDEIITEEK